MISDPGTAALVVTAAKLYAVKGTGIDIDPQRIQEANANAKKEKHRPRRFVS